MKAVKTFAERIIDRLVQDGILARSVATELFESEKTKERRIVLRTALERGYFMEEDLVVAMSRVLKTAPIRIDHVSIPDDIMALLGSDFCSAHKIIPIARLGNMLFLAMADPLDVLTIDDVRRLTKMSIRVMIAGETDIIHRLRPRPS
jgi:type IV pilus assembly protein PilB